MSKLPRTRILLSLAIATALAACSSTVVRETGSGTVTGGTRAPTVVSAPKYGASTVVQRGDTLYKIASGNGVSVLDLASWNRLAAPYTIYPGQRLRLYPQDGNATPPPRASSGSSTATAPSRPGTTPAAPVASQPSTRPSTPPAAPASSGIRWQWPAEGQMVNGFVSGDPTRQGIDIAGRGGAQVRSAGDGVVVYSGSGLVGYGELIIIKHNDQWLSAYGHNRSRMVNEGQVVKAGQQIAEMGRSGASRDMLHFEVRYNGKPVDPLQQLPRR
ncbi:peptidoglycan DD-metalloendopeptidase family protein [Montanilutibacter psychrotolerans]|nr:peptidoglycan DD-metalloendopeptidase family protein [Lysobacter psychrotolerans]